MSDDVERSEEAANLENEAIAAMQALVEEHGYTEEDLQGMIRTAVLGD